MNKNIPPITKKIDWKPGTLIRMEDSRRFANFYRHPFLYGDSFVRSIPKDALLVFLEHLNGTENVLSGTTYKVLWGEVVGYINANKWGKVEDNETKEIAG